MKRTFIMALVLSTNLFICNLVQAETLPIPGNMELHQYSADIDLNNDGLMDQVRLLIDITKPKWGLYVFMAKKHGYEIYPLLEQEGDRNFIQYTMETLPPGEYEVPLTGEIIKTPFAGINVYIPETCEVNYYFWNPKKKQFMEYYMGR